jgi:hypothetical protein
VGKSTAAILGIALLAGAAIWIGRAYLNPAAEQSERNESVLTGAMDPRLQEIEVVQDADLPDGVPAPQVGEDAMYLRVSVLYPGLPDVPEPHRHKLTRVNGQPAVAQDPAHVETEVDDSGALVHLLFRVDPGFESGAIARGKKTILKSFVLE